ncbi:MAG: Asp-tRNA(Asn)/Glu-tRNA(Gln) amidotransferase subunit GatA [Vampirovibrio sp.]|nr:Asp-tRNA(Asn)/Glu-tRNA(Gln) amidotransferase subunit GatA [Vampirovibrio sp.]
MSPNSEEITAIDLHEQIKSGKRKAREVLDETFARIDKMDTQVGAFLTLTQEHAYQVADEVDRKVAAKENLPMLAGVPIAVKDNINMTGVPTTCGSKILGGFVSPYGATAYQKLRERLMPVVGKTNMDEFAMGSSTENSALKVTHNPWDLDRVPGGSSGGSAAAVSSGEVLISLGSDTGGSVRQPAALCGVYGIKPTYGTVSRYGLVAFGSSLDQISPFGRNVHDTAATLSAIMGFDPKDSTSVEPQGSQNYFRDIEMGIRGLKVGYIQELKGDGMQPEVATSFDAAIKTLTDMGAEVVPISLSTVNLAVAAYYIVATAEASSNLARFDGVRYGARKEEGVNDIKAMYRKTRMDGFGAEVKRRIMLGTFSLSSGYYDAFYGKAQKVRKLMRQEFEDAWRDVDVLICPTSPTTAFKIGEKADDPVQMYLSDIATIPVNMTGIPGISIPCGFDNDNMPIGLQILGPHFSESLLFRVARAFERETGLTNLQPKWG